MIVIQQDTWGGEWKVTEVPVGPHPLCDSVHDDLDSALRYCRQQAQETLDRAAALREELEECESWLDQIQALIIKLKELDEGG